MSLLMILALEIQPTLNHQEVLLQCLRLYLIMYSPTLLLLLLLLLYPLVPPIRFGSAVFLAT